MTPPIDPVPHSRNRSPARGIAVVYAMLLLSFLAFPAGVSEWFSDHCEEGATCRVLVGVVRGAEKASRRLGVAGLLESTRDEARRDLDLDQD